jgi:hypothetical protein
VSLHYEIFTLVNCDAHRFHHGKHSISFVARVKLVFPMRSLSGLKTPELSVLLHHLLGQCFVDVISILGPLPSQRLKVRNHIECSLTSN